MDVVAKMKCTSINKSGGDPKHPHVRVEFGAVYTSDPESENRSFAQATPTASASLSIDPGRPASNAFEHGCEYLVTFTPVGIPQRTYLKDGMPPNETEILLMTRDGQDSCRARFTPGKNILAATIDGEAIEASWGFEKFLDRGFTHWRYLREGE